MKLTPELKAELEQLGYVKVVETKNYGIIAINRFMFTFGLLVDATGDKGNMYDRRYCYPSLSDALFGLNCLIIQDEMEVPRKHPIDPYWIKCKGNGLDIHNPNNPKLVNEIV